METPSIEDFRLKFTAFEDVEKYQDETIQFQFDIAQTMFSKRIYNKIYSHVIYLYTAHNLVINEQIKSDIDGAFSLAGGSVTSESKTVGSLSKSTGRNGGLTALDKQGQFGLTIYGQQLLQIIRTYGACVMVI